MEDNGLKLYFMNTEELLDEAYYQTCYNSLSSYRQDKIDRQHFDADKRRSMAAGLLMDQGLQAYGLREAQVRICQGENGKPYLPDYPEIHYNLAHSGNMAMAVFADAEAGCDIEKFRTADLKLARRFFCPDEYVYIAALDGQKQNHAFVRLWTLKESFLKVTGMGMRLPLNSFEFQFSEDDLCVTIQQNFDKKSYRFVEKDFDGCHAAVCIQDLSGSDRKES